jgi:hypothetical protein
VFGIEDAAATETDPSDMVTRVDVISVVSYMPVISETIPLVEVLNVPIPRSTGFVDRVLVTALNEVPIWDI